MSQFSPPPQPREKPLTKEFFERIELQNVLNSYFVLLCEHGDVMVSLFDVNDK